MKELKAYVENKNRWNLIFSNRCYDLAVAADRQRIADALDADLSPENLTCDGEMSRAQVISRNQGVKLKTIFEIFFFLDFLKTLFIRIFV